MPYRFSFPSPLAAALFGLLASLAILQTASGQPSSDQRPNVVVVITDDQGHGDLACHGNPVLKTPSIDKLFEQSVRLADFHVAPTCTPSRAALLTGRWTNRTGAWHTINGRSILRAEETTLANVFQDAGYATGMFGKWHLGDNYPYRPTDRGFDEVMCHGGGGVGQTPDYWDNAYFDGTYFHNNKPTPVKGFCTDVFFDYATSFIRKQKEKDQPFLAYISTNAAHGPYHAPPEYSKPYEHLGIGVANFFGMIANIDDNVGKLRDVLEKEGIADDTIFIFMTDNGTSAGGKVYNSGMRGFKGSPYDGGHRVPFFIHWPGKFDQGRDVLPITAHIDIMPTLLDLCGIETPSDIAFDGRSLRPLLENESARWPERILITDSQRIEQPEKWRGSSVMTDQYRLVNQKELYDIKADPGQKNNIADEHPEVVGRLQRFYESWWDELSPTFAAPTPIYLGTPHENPVALTCHDWTNETASPWNQSLIRKSLDTEAVDGFWHVNVVEAGDYEIRLRRWPVESGFAIDASVAPGAPVPGVDAFRMTPGEAIDVKTATLQIADVESTQLVSSGDQDAAFRVTLPAGATKLRAIFTTEQGKSYGAYYAYVQKL
ncbi:arylsulfatase [Rubripirellula amarantea]|nr:arylsulfatase [Rubripirellula amarantea]